MKRLTCFCPQETADTLSCPERGFYSILRYMASDEAAVSEEIFRHGNDTLLLVEINLCAYADGDLSSAAMGGISALLHRLRAPGCGLILRFLYDWDGKNMLTEPRSIGTILRHMEQLGPLIRENADGIYLTQGLFVGNWGEMHGSRYLRKDSLKRLCAAFSASVGDKVRISLRTPALWRGIVGLSDDAELESAVLALTSPPALFNDGMLGSESDIGTYGGGFRERERELTFQNKLCRFVPNGGEVVGDTPLSDPAPAMQTLARMRVSYLNREYDRRTLDKWKLARVSDPGIWNGMSYFDYAEAHMGYRFVVRSVNLGLSAFTGTLNAEIAVENIGFAPIYHDTAAELVFVGAGGETAFPMSGSASRLVSGSKPGLFTARLASLPERLQEAGYDVYFRLHSLKYGVTILTANEGCSRRGLPIGRYVEK